MKLRIAPKTLPLCALVIIPQIMFVGGMIAKIKHIAQLKPKYLFVLAIIHSLNKKIFVQLLYKNCRFLSTQFFIVIKIMCLFIYMYLFQKVC